MAGRFRTAFRDALRVLHTLTLEVLGGLFLALAIMGGASVVQEYQQYASDPERGVWRIALSAVFSICMLGFGVHNFWKSRTLQK